MLGRVLPIPGAEHGLFFASDSSIQMSSLLEIAGHASR